jgi:hypothetical protein
MCAWSHDGITFIWCDQYEVPECDLIILKRHVRVAPGVKLYKFGIKLMNGATWTEWEFQHPACVAELHKLESLVYDGRYMQDYYVDNNHGQIPDQVTWVGDPQVLHDAWMYLTLMCVS